LPTKDASVKKQSKPNKAGEPGVVTKSLKFLGEDEEVKLEKSAFEQLQELLYERRAGELRELTAMAFDQGEKQYYSRWYAEVYLPNQNEMLGLWLG